STTRGSAPTWLLSLFASAVALFAQVGDVARPSELTGRLRVAMVVGVIEEHVEIGRNVEEEPGIRAPPDVVRAEEPTMLPVGPEVVREVVVADREVELVEEQVVDAAEEPDVLSVLVVVDRCGAHGAGADRDPCARGLVVPLIDDHGVDRDRQAWRDLEPGVEDRPQVMIDERLPLQLVAQD